MTYPDLTADGFSSRVVMPSGDGSSGVMFVAEAPGEMEDKTGEVLHRYAPAGSMFERILKRAGLTRDRFTLTNVVWQRPPSNHLEHTRYEQMAVAAWRPHLERLIQERQPKVIVTLGNMALRTLTTYGSKGTTIGQVHSYVLSSVYDAWVIPAFHPSYLIQGGHHLIGAVRYSIDYALEIARQGFVRKPVRYVWDNLEALLEFERGFNPDQHTLSYDIETPESHKLDEDQLETELQPRDDKPDEEDEDETEATPPPELDASYNIIRVSLCYDAVTGYAISVPWQPPYIKIVKRMLAGTKRRRVWHAGFDDPRLRANGCTLGGECWDMMECWSMLQRSLPRALSFVTPFYGWTGQPWKYLNLSDPPFYSCCDAHALQQNGDGIERDLRTQGKWEMVRRHVVETYEVLTQIARNGLPYNATTATNFRAELQVKLTERQAELQRRVPDELKPSKQKYGYKKTPKDTTGLARRSFVLLGQDMTEDELVAQPTPALGQASVERWCLLEPFLPTSPQQVLVLVRFYGHKVGRNRKTKRDSVDAEVLRRLLRQCRGKSAKEQEKGATYQLIKECRKLSKVIGTYVDGWKPGRDGRIHATPGFWGKMHRISWRRPNIAAVIADKDEEAIAAGFRRCVEARAGHLLVECDWKGMEAVLVGWFASDTDYMRLARLGVHDFMGLHMLGEKVDLGESDEALRDRFHWFKKNYEKLRDDAKHTIHGTNYCMGPLLMADLYQMTVARAKQLQALYFDLFPKIKAWQHQVLRLADKEGKLVNPFQYTLQFWDVTRWDNRKYERLRQQGVSEAMASTQAVTLGKDAKSAVSFLPRDTGAAMLKEVLLRLRPLAEEGIMIGTSHDSILSEIPESQLESVASRIKCEMERPEPKLGGLSIDVEVSVGKVWDKKVMQPLVLTASAVA